MKIVRSELSQIRLPLRDELFTAHGPIRERLGLLLRLETDRHVAGHGESFPIVGFGLESLEQSQERLEQAARSLLGQKVSGLEDWLASEIEAVSQAPAAHAAAECACLDLVAQAAGEPAAWLLTRGPVHASVPVHGLVTRANWQRDVQQAAAAGFRTLKLKLGAAEFAEDLAHVQAVRKQVGPAMRLRLDANAAWDEDVARDAIRQLTAHDIEFIEQPVAAEDVDALARLRELGWIRIAADESLSDAPRAERIIREKLVDVVVLKPPVLGGLRAAQRLALQARQAGMDVVVTSLIDSAIGRAAALQLAVTLPEPQVACGLATHTLLEDDLSQRLICGEGELQVPFQPGIGVAPDPAALIRLRGTRQVWE